MRRSSEDAVGKTLREVKALYPFVRVTSIPGVTIRNTCDLRPGRLNVKLSPTGLKFLTETYEFDGKSIEVKKVDGSMDDGVVVEAYWG